MAHPSIHAQLMPDKVAYRMADTDQGLTFRELEAASNQAAHLFRSLWIRPGDHIAFLLQNRLEFLIICWAAQRSGLYCTPISTHLSPGEIAYILDNCAAKLFVADAELADLAAQALPGLSPHAHRLVIGGTLEGFADWDMAVGSMPEVPVADEVAGCNMFYSSGTTGRPKGVKPARVDEDIRTSGPLQLKLCRDIAGLNVEAVYLSPAPLYHAAPLLFSMMTAALGGTTIIERRFSAEHFLKHIEQNHVTHTQVVPTMFVRLLKLPEAVRKAYDLSSLKVAVHAAAPCPIHVKQAKIDWWGPILVEYYGATEAYGITTIDSTDWLAHPGSVGRAALGVLKVVGDNGEELPAGEVGGIYFADGPKFVYHNEPEKTRNAYNAKGWATVGDVGYVDRNGYLYLTDRKAFVINSGGVNVYPQQAEDVLISHPQVIDAAVFGIPDEDLGEAVKAVVQPSDMADAGPELEAELVSFCRKHLSTLSCPRSIDFRSELPRTATGKLNKVPLRDEYRAAHKRATMGTGHGSGRGHT